MWGANEMRGKGRLCGGVLLSLFSALICGLMCWEGLKSDERNHGWPGRAETILSLVNPTKLISIDDAHQDPADSGITFVLGNIPWTEYDWVIVSRLGVQYKPVFPLGGLPVFQNFLRFLPTTINVFRKTSSERANQKWKHDAIQCKQMVPYSSK
jgi:hypothetical protein